MQKVQKGLQGYVYLPPSFFPNLEAAINRMSYEPANDISGLYKQVCECVLFLKTSMNGTGSTPYASFEDVSWILHYNVLIYKNSA